MFNRHFRAALAASIVLFTAVATAETIDLNTADAATLARVLAGVGPSKAEAIVMHRQSNGPFLTVDDLAMVKGIGPALVEQNRERLSVGAQPPAARGTGSKAPVASQTK